MCGPVPAPTTAAPRARTSSLVWMSTPASRRASTVLASPLVAALSNFVACPGAEGAMLGSARRRPQRMPPRCRLTDGESRGRRRALSYDAACPPRLLSHPRSPALLVGSRCHVIRCLLPPPACSVCEHGGAVARCALGGVSRQPSLAPLGHRLRSHAASRRQSAHAVQCDAQRCRGAPASSLPCPWGRTACGVHVWRAGADAQGRPGRAYARPVQLAGCGCERVCASNVRVERPGAPGKDG